MRCQRQSGIRLSLLHSHRLQSGCTCGDRKESDCTPDAAREGLGALITIGTNWNDVPDDAPPPRAVDIVTDLSQAYAEWAEDYTLHAVPPPELLNMLIAPILAFNHNTWPHIEVEDALSFDAYDVVERAMNLLLQRSMVESYASRSPSGP